MKSQPFRGVPSGPCSIHSVSHPSNCDATLELRACSTFPLLLFLELDISGIALKGEIDTRDELDCRRRIWVVLAASDLEAVDAVLMNGLSVGAHT